MSKQRECRSSLDTLSDMADAAAGAVMPLVLLVALFFVGWITLAFINAIGMAGVLAVGALVPLILVGRTDAKPRTEAPRERITPPLF